MVKYSFSDERIVYRSFFSYAVDKLHAHAALCEDATYMSTETISQNRDLDPCLCERRTANNRTFAFCMTSFKR